MAHNIEAILQLKDNMSATLKIADSNLKSFGKTLSTQGRGLRDLGTTLGYLGKDLMKLNAPFLALGGWASKLGMDFEAVTSEAQAVMNATSAEMDVFKDKAREVGAATSKSATESMEGMKLLGQAGLEQKEILELTLPLVRLSEAGNLDMARSADLLTNSMKSAEIPLENAGQYLDQIALSANESNTSIEQQLEAWNSAGGSISSANMKMSEANALFGVMANRGVKAGEAGNAVSRVFQNLNATTGEAGKAMEKLGISVENSDGSMRNKIEVLKELKEKTDGMTESQREQYLTMIGGKAHTENLKKMLAGLGDEYDDLESKLDNANGALEKMAITMKDNLKGRLETLSSASEEFGLKLADVLLPKIEDVIDKVQGFVDSLNEMDSEQLETIVNIVLLSTKIALLLMVVGGATRMFGQFTRNIGDLLGMFSEGSILSGMFGASGLQLVGIFVLIGIVIAAVVKHWDKIGPAVKDAYNAIKDFITGSEEIMQSLEGVKEAIGGLLEGIATFIQGALEVITGIFSGDGEMIKEGLSNMFKGGIEIVKNLWNGLIDLLSVPISAGVELLKGRFPEVAELIQTKWDNLKTFLKHPIRSTVNLASGVFMGAVSKVRGAWSRIKTFLSADAEGKAELLSDAFHRGIDRAKKAWEGLKTFVKNPIKGTVNLAQKGAGWLQNKMAGNNWQGTSNWRGGPTYLHEKGPEIFDLPDGTRVYPHDKSIDRAFKDGQSTAKGSSINIPKLADTIVVREEADIDKIADRLATKVEKVVFNMA